VSRLFFALALAFTVGGALTLAGCPASHPGYPNTACKVPSDCFQGEACIANTCVSVDMSGPPLDFSTPMDLSTMGDAE